MKNFGKDKGIKIIKVRKNDYLIIKPSDVNKLKHYHIDPEVPFEDKVETRNVPLNRFYNSNGMTSNRGAYQHSYDDPNFRHLHNYDEDSYVANASRPRKTKYQNSVSSRNKKGLDTFQGMFNKTNNRNDDQMPFNKDDSKYFKSNNHEYDVMDPSYNNVNYKKDDWPVEDSEEEFDQDRVRDGRNAQKDEIENGQADQFDDEDIDLINNGEGNLDRSEYDQEENKQQNNDNLKGLIRSVAGANLVFKKEEPDGNYNELWIYNVGDDSFKESKIRKAILAGTDIDPYSMSSGDEKQKAQTYTLGNVQFLEISGLPN
jgi:hypothetical protein